jgi:hypothetical protein
LPAREQINQFGNVEGFWWVALDIRTAAISYRVSL